MSLFSDFRKCKWYVKGDFTNVWSLGYCHCPARHPKPPAIALIHCLGADCGYYTPLSTQTFTVTTSAEEENKEMTNVEKIIDEKDKIIEDLKAEDKRLNQVIIDKCQEIAILKQDNEHQRFIIDQQQDIMILLFRLLEIYNDREAILH